MSARRRSHRPIDWVLIATLVPLFVAALAVHVREGIATGLPDADLSVSSAPNGEDFPFVENVLPEARFEGPRIEVGDRILSAAGRSLAGMSWARFAVQVLPEGRRPEGVHLEIARGEERFATTFFIRPLQYWWSAIPNALAFVLVALIILLRAPEWPLARLFFVYALVSGISAATRHGHFGVDPTVATGGLLLALVTFPLTIATGVAVLWQLTPSARPLPAWARAQPWIIGIGLLASSVAGYLLPRPADRIAFSVLFAILALAILSMLVGLTRAYRRSDPLERRQIRWILYGLYVALLPSLVVAAYHVSVLMLSPDLSAAITGLALTALPLGFLAAVLGYRFLDIDRLISATTSYTILGVILLGVALQVIPGVAEAAGPALGVSPGTGQWVLSIGFAAIVVQGHRWLRPWLDRRLFAQRVAVEAGLAKLVAELGGCRSSQELTRLSGERLDVLLQPDSLAVYAREETAFTPVYARGRAVPPAFAADSALVKTLESRSEPLVAAVATLDPFDRAALATLGAEVVIPTRRGGALVAFTCLGLKRTGDIYTPAELALLTAVASASGEVLQRLGDGEVLAQARAMHESMRRYVPGAVAEQIESGRDLQAGEREVTVLFVDLRGYSSFAEKRRVEDVFSTVNEHTERVSRIVRARGGAIVEFNGDGMMAVFGAPEALADKERRAVEAAREIVDTSPADLPVGIGIATGLGYAGNIRAADRFIWTVIGDTTNLAARLQAMTRELEASIAIDEPTRLGGGYVCADFARHRDVPVRGRSQRVDVFALPLALAAAA